jgi:hypothetical protein
VFEEALAMSEVSTEAAQWLSHEDQVCREARLARLEWLSSLVPAADYWTFPGGLTAKLVFEEMRFCFLYGQFLASIVLGLAYIERTLASEFYAAGRNDLERAGIAQLLREAQLVGMLTNAEAGEIDRIRMARNPVIHFRRPLDDESIEYRSISNNEQPYDLLDSDARAVVHMAMTTWPAPRNLIQSL